MTTPHKRDRNTDPLKADRLPPHSSDAEAGVLGCVLLAPSECLDELGEMGFRADWCYGLAHQQIFDAAWSLHHGTPRVGVDLVTLQEELKRRGDLEKVGGLAYIAALPDGVPSASRLRDYAEIIREKWQRRLLIRTCTEVVGRVYEDEDDTEQLLASVQKTFLELDQRVMRSTEQTIKVIIKDRVMPDLDEHYTRGKAQIRGLTTGLEYLDKIFCGLGGKHGNYIVVAARPNTGKTSLATQIAMHAALDHTWWEQECDEAGTKLWNQDADNKDVPRMIQKRGVPVAISSLEMSSDALVQKMLFQRGKADLQRWRTGFAIQDDVKLLSIAAGHLAAANNIVIDDTPRVRIGQLKAKWRRWYRQYGVRLFILDYLQLMQADGKRGRPDRVQELAEVSAELQALGKELNCPMIILAQMNRDFEKDPLRNPRMSDLKDCGAVEQDADIVAFLHEPKLSEKALAYFNNAMDQAHSKDEHGEKRDWRKWDGKPQRINVLVGKNRFGPKGKAELLLQHTSTTFVDWNVWLKEKKIKAPAAGEESHYQKGQFDEGDESD